MKTFKTENLDFEYDVQVDEFTNIFDHRMTTVTITVICIEGDETFQIDVPNYGDEVFDFSEDDLEDDHLKEASKWVEETVVSKATARLAVLCLKKTTDFEYWSFSVSTATAFRVSIVVFEKVDGYVGKTKYALNAVGEEEIGALIYSKLN